MLVYVRRTGMPGHEVALQPRYAKQPINITHLSLVSEIPGYCSRYVGDEMTNGLTFFHNSPTSVQTFCEVRNWYSPFVSLGLCHIFPGLRRVAASTTRTINSQKKTGYEVKATLPSKYTSWERYNWGYCDSPVAFWDELNQKILCYKTASILWIYIKVLLCWYYHGFYLIKSIKINMVYTKFTS